MKIKTSELTGVQLDWAVAAANQLKVVLHGKSIQVWLVDSLTKEPEVLVNYRPSTSWSQGGPIIERERIVVQFGPLWTAVHHKRLGQPSYGPTPLIAAMRCYVASKLGNEVDVPEELA